MPRSEEKQRELDRLRSVLLAFVEFTRTHGLGTLADLALDGIEREHIAGRLGGLREALSDDLEGTADLSGSELRDLDALLRERAGVRLDDLLGKRVEKLAAIRKRGRITTDAQFRLVLTRVDEVYADSERSSELEELNRMLAAYEVGRPSNRRAV